MQIFPRDQAEIPKRVSPVDKMISDLPGTFFKVSEVAEILKVHPVTLRRWMKRKDLKAPSMVCVQGGMKVYLYTPKDVEELRRVMSPDVRKRGA